MGMHSVVRVVATAFLFLSLSSEVLAQERQVAILIPGTLNALVPGSVSLEDFPFLHQKNPYFSEAIVSTLESRGFDTYVVRGLTWCGQLEANGDITLREIRDWYRERYPLADVPITLIGHSAGGLYALRAMSQATDLPIRAIYLLASPLHGSTLANTVLESGVVGKMVEKIIHATSGLLDLRGLSAMSTRNIDVFLSNLRIPPQIKLYAIGSSQRITWNPLKWFLPEYMAPIFVPAAEWIGEPSDGIVELSSALGTGVLIPSSIPGHGVPIQPVDTVHMNSDHAEQFLDYRYFALFGTTHRSRIAEEQARVFNEIADLAL